LIEDSGKGELWMDMNNIVMGICPFPAFMDPGHSNVIDGINTQILDNDVIEDLVSAFICDYKRINKNSVE